MDKSSEQGGPVGLMGAGRDIAVLFGSAPHALCRLDEHGWLALSGEPGADLNMAYVSHPGSAAAVNRYVDEIEARELEAILIVDDAPELVEAALARGLTSAGSVPLMIWREDSPPDRVPAHPVRRAEETEFEAANAAIAEAFSLDEATVQRAMPPAIAAAGADVWIVEAEGTIAGSGTFVRFGDHVGIYCMATRPGFQKQGIGRAVLDAAMRHYFADGVTTFTLEATAQGKRLYEQTGFKTRAEAPVFVIGSSTQF